MQTFDPYYEWLGISREEQPPTHYRLLGIRSLESDPRVIENAAERQMLFLRQFQGGPRGEHAQPLLNAIAQARLVLLDPARKAAYDQALLAAEAAASTPLMMAVELPPPQPAALPNADPLAQSFPFAPGRAVTRAPRRKTNDSQLLLITAAGGVVAVLAVLVIAMLVRGRGQSAPSGATGTVDPPRPAVTSNSKPPPSKPPQENTPPTNPQPPPVVTPVPSSAPEKTDAVEIKLRRLPAGEFLMGSPESQPDRGGDEPQHRVRLTRPFLIGTYEVTQQQYLAVMGTNPAKFTAENYPETSGDALLRPVEAISWLDAIAFCNKLSERNGRPAYYKLAGDRVSIIGGHGYRLPTEAEWEYACRGGTDTAFLWGNDVESVLQHAWTMDNAGDEFVPATRWRELFDKDRPAYGELWAKVRTRPHPVGQKLANRFGLHDMQGNVWEWCWDHYGTDYYRNSPAADPQGPDQGTERVMRGAGHGNWSGIGLDFCLFRPAKREHRMERERSDAIGMRIACDEPVEATPATTDAPAAAIVVNKMKPQSIDDDAAFPAYLRGGTKFVWAEPAQTAVENGKLEFSVEKPTWVYLIAHWHYQGNAGGGWTDSRLSKEQLLAQGWQYVETSATLGEPNKPVEIFKKECRAGEKYSLRTNKYWPPFPVLPP